MWQFLSDGRSAVSEVPTDRWSPFDDGSAEVDAALAATTRWGSFLNDVDAFDAAFFEIMPREAAKMDPQQRLLLEVAWEALEARRHAAEYVAALPNRCLHRRLRQRVRIPGRERPAFRRRLEQHRRRAEHHREPAVVFPGPARTVSRSRHRLFVLAGRHSSRVPEPAHRRFGPGDRRRGEPVDVARDLPRFRSGRRLVADGRVSRVRRQCGRFRARRGVRCRRAQAAERRPARWRPDSGGCPWFRDQPGRPFQRFDGTQPGCPNGSAAKGIRQRGREPPRGGLRRGARHRNLLG